MAGITVIGLKRLNKFHTRGEEFITQKTSWMSIYLAFSSGD